MIEQESAQQFSNDTCVRVCLTYSEVNDILRSELYYTFDLDFTSPFDLFHVTATND